MNRILYIVFLFIIVIYSIYPQNSINNYQETNNIIEFELSLSSIPHKNIIKGTNLLVNFNNFQDESQPGGNALPTRDVIIALPSYSKITANLTTISANKIKGRPVINSSVSSTDNKSVIYKDVPAKGNNIRKNLIEVKGYLWFRNYYCVHLKIYQYLSNNDIIEELQRVKLTFRLNTPGNSKAANIKEGKEEKEFLSSTILNYQNAKPLDKKYYEPEANNSSWIDFSKTYLKLGTNADGIYRITKSDLENYGIDPQAISLNTFQMYLKGSQVPITVVDSLGVLKYIEFFGRRNWGDNYRETSGPNETYKEYLNRYSDTTIYWLTWGGGTGIPTTEQQGNIGTPTDTIEYYAEIAHYEQNEWLDYSMADLVARQLPMWKQNQTWVWGQQQQDSVGGVPPIYFPFSATDIYPGKTAQAFYKIQDYASNFLTNAHLIGLSINSDTAVYSSGYFDKYAQVVIKAVFNSNLLAEGNNTLKATSYTIKHESLNSVEYDWYEVEYPRYLKAINDSLRFTINDIQGNSIKAFKLTNLSSANMILYKYNQGIKKIINCIRIGDQLVFNDTVQAGDKYYLINESRIGSPYYFYTKKFTDIASSSIQADYILITHPVFVSKANEYAAFISQNYGLATKVINVFDIYDQFNYGFFAPEPIRDFLIAAQSNWQSPKPLYLLLVGGANYDYYGNKVLYFNTPPVMNFVPSFGQPVSDTWFTIWDTTGVLIPQMYPGRIPASSLDEFQHFFDKHKAYLSTPFDDWNKYYLLFSSGDGTDPNQLSTIKQTSDSVIANFIQPPPIGGIAQHLYKTYSPPTDFGPYTQDQINSMIGMGGVFISYIGHSGTQIWDNGISDVTQLKNNRGRSSMISDFGCSTGEFAEPDIKAFSELFVTGLDGDAIGYEGNSSLGFSSTATTFPLLFYKKILKDNIFELGKAHVMAKIDMLQTYGSGGVYGVFAYSNTLFSDPVIKLQVPPKPNLTISAKNISLSENFLDESIDSVTVKILYNNYGMVLPQYFTVGITHSINGILKDTLSLRRLLPMMTDSITFRIPVKGFVGSHQLDVVLDKNNEIDEIYKNDNDASFTFNVTSNAIRILSTEPINNIGNGAFIYINPVNKSVSDSIQFESANNQGFSPSQIYYKKLDTAYTKVSISGLVQGSRYWFRSKLSGAQEYGSTISFIYDSASTTSYYLGDSISFSSLHLNGIKYDGTKLLLDKTYKNLVVKSAGYYDGGFAFIGIDGNDLLTSSNLDGIQVVVFSDSNLTFESTERFNYWDDNTAFNYNFKHFLDTVSAQKIVCFAFCGGAGFGITDSMKTLLHQFGSKYIDSVDFRYSWALIGKKGSIPGTVPEKWSKPYGGFVTLDSLFTYDIKSGALTTGQFGPVKKWNKFKANYTAVNGSVISFVPIGIKQDGTADTLQTLNIINGETDLSFINPSIYGNLEIVVNFSKGISSVPSINNIKLEYDNLPEIGTNYQAVSILKDTVTIGENLNLNFKVLNEGFIRADSINVRLDRIMPDNSRETISQSTIDYLLSGTSKSYNIIYPTVGGAGSGSFVINIDPDKKIKEFFKDNNLYTVPFYVKGDTTHPSLRLTIGDSEILDGDYVSSTPKIRGELDDLTLLPITDSTSIIMTLNDSLISDLNNQFVKVYFSPTNPKMVIEYTPKLADGEYVLNVKGRNALGVLTDSAGITRRFLVSAEVKLLDVYNYPNPFKNETYFTFKLTQIPDELKIKIFSVAGRLIKVLYKKSNELNYDFNRIYWDGRDSQGDHLANGVYFYKMIMKKGDKTESVTQKMAIIR
jgi:hypothetical protein